MQNRLHPGTSHCTGAHRGLMVRARIGVIESAFVATNGFTSRRAFSKCGRIIAAAAGAALVLGSTPTNPTAPPPTAPAPTPEERAPAQPAIDLDRLDRLLTLGDAALKANRLLTPPGDCAYDYYRDALAVAPNHPSALAGLDRIVDRYVAMANDAIQRGRYDRANNLLERARFINPDHEGIATADQQIKLLQSSDRRRIALDGASLSARSSEMSASLAKLGVEAKADNAWVVITARSDEEGRWIYQQLRTAPGERRIHAELVIGAPSVEIYQLKSSAP